MSLIAPKTLRVQVKYTTLMRLLFTNRYQKLAIMEYIELKNRHPNLVVSIRIYCSLLYESTTVLNAKD